VRWVCLPSPARYTSPLTLIVPEPSRLQTPASPTTSAPRTVRERLTISRVQASPRPYPSTVNQTAYHSSLLDQAPVMAHTVSPSSQTESSKRTPLSTVTPRSVSSFILFPSSCSSPSLRCCFQYYNELSSKICNRTTADCGRDYYLQLRGRWVEGHNHERNVFIYRGWHWFDWLDLIGFVMVWNLRCDSNITVIYCFPVVCYCWCFSWLTCNQKKLIKNVALKFFVFGLR